MPRSKNIANYGQFFWRLLLGMKARRPEITIELPANKAHQMRHQAYGFLYALEAQAKQFEKQGQMQSAGDYTRDANVMRGYLIRVDIDGVSRNNIKPHETQLASLRFIHRDMNPDIQDAFEQLAAQVPEELERELPQENLDDLLDIDINPMPSIDSFFDSPLETPETRKKTHEEE